MAVLISHPIHYQVPLFRKLAQRFDIDLTVYFCCDEGVTARFHKDLAVEYRWDIPLLGGYRYRFLRNWSPRPDLGRFFGLCNLGIVLELWKHRYDVLMVHGYSYFVNLIAMAVARILGTVVLFRGETVMRGKSLWYRRLPKAMILGLMRRSVDAYLAIGSRSREFYLRQGIEATRVFFTPYCVDNDSFMTGANQGRLDRERLREGLNVPAEIPLVFYCGKLIHKKRPDDLLRAFAPLADRAALAFVGDGPMRKGLESAAAALKYVRFLGFRNQSEMPGLYGGADVFVLPSSALEVSPLVLNEAMCAGLPIIVSDAVPSARDFVTDDDNGYIYPVGDVEALSRCLKLLVDDPERRTRMGQRSKERIAPWNYDACVGGIMEALNFVAKAWGS